MGRINSKKYVVDGIEFDSETEGRYYSFLKSQPHVYDIIIQPNFTLIEAFKVDCIHCEGDGKVKSSKTGNLVNCKKCQGTGKKRRKAWTYTADFEVEYTNSWREVIDVKGYANERFPLVKKMFEYVHGGAPLTVVEWDKKKKEWVKS